MGFINMELKDTYLLTTEVENLYINESMIDAPGNYVKVYLYGLYASKYIENATIKTIAKTLNLDVIEVDQAYTYWESLGLVKKEGSLSDYNYDIIYISQRELLYGNVPKIKENVSNELIDLSLKNIFKVAEECFARPLSSNECNTIKSWRVDYHISQEVIEEAIKYCTSRGKNNINYIGKVVIDWDKNGLKTLSDVEDHLRNIDERNDSYKKVLRSIGITRNVTEAEKKLIDTWFDELHFNIDKILEACSRTISTTNPNLRYVNKILENWADEAKAFGRDVNSTSKVTIKDVNEYLNFLRSKALEEREERLNKIYNLIPRIKEIDQELISSQGSVGKLVLQGRDVSALKDRIKFLESERAALLTENNFEIDYSDTKYKCEICKDTGLDLNGQRCKCFNERFNEAELWLKK